MVTRNDWLTQYEDYTSSFEPPQLFNRWLGLVALSTATQRQIYLPDAFSRIWPNLFVVLCGPSGTGKTQAMRAMFPVLEGLGIRRSPDKATAAYLARDLSESAVNDKLTEAWKTPYLIWAEELPSFMGMDAAKSGMFADLTALYDSPDKWFKGTTTQGESIIPYPFVCMVAGTTPQGLHDVLPLSTVGQGFTSRVVFPYAGYSQKRVPFKVWGKKEEAALLMLQKDLVVISKLQGSMSFSQAAKVQWEQYYNERKMPTDEFDDERLRGYSARKPLNIQKIAMLVSLSRGDDLIITGPDLNKSILMQHELDAGMYAVFAELTSSPINSAYKIALEHLEKATDHTLTHAELMRKLCHRLDAKQFAMMIDGLVQTEQIDKIVDSTRVINGRIRMKVTYKKF